MWYGMQWWRDFFSWQGVASIRGQMPCLQVNLSCDFWPENLLHVLPPAVNAVAGFQANFPMATNQGSIMHSCWHQVPRLFYPWGHHSFDSFLGCLLFGKSHPYGWPITPRALLQIDALAWVTTCSWYTKCKKWLCYILGMNHWWIRWTVLSTPHSHYCPSEHGLAL